MAETTLTLPQQITKPAGEVKVITYWGAVRAKLWRDKITMFAILLGLFMITITLAAPWIAENVTGFDPLDTNLRNRNAPGPKRPGQNLKSSPVPARAAAVIGHSGRRSFPTRRPVCVNV